MNNVWVIRLFRTSDPSTTLFQFVCYDDEGVANACAGEALDAYHDATDGPSDFDYSVTAAPYIHSMNTNRIAEAARRAAP